MSIKHVGKSPFQIMQETKKIIKQLPVKVANTALNHFKDNFIKESWDGRAWAKHKGWSRPGESSPKILRNKNTLYDNLIKAVNGNHIKVYVGKPADKYADIHNFGGTITIPPNDKTKKWAWAMFYKTKLSFYKAIALKMRSGKPIKGRIPQRQFIGESPVLNGKIQKKIEREIDKINKL